MPFLSYVIALGFLNIVFSESAHSRYTDLICGNYLIRIAGNENVAQRTVIQNTSGISVGTIDGADFYIESKKKRFLRKPIPNSVISFWSLLDTGTNSGTFQFYRSTSPNKYGVLTKQTALGPEIYVRAGETKDTIIDSSFYVRTFCVTKPRYQ